MMPLVWIMILAPAVISPHAGHPSEKKDRKQRWDVKTITDSSFIGIRWKADSTTIRAQVQMQLDTIWSQKMHRRPDESQLYSLSCYVDSACLERDGDYHLILRDSGSSLIGEIPSPQNCPPMFAKQLLAARSLIDSLFGGRRSKRLTQHWRHRTAVKVDIKGLGFWDRKNHGKASAHDGREIHPILELSLAED